jgi:cytochrome c-type biogenesis protein CcmE
VRWIVAGAIALSVALAIGLYVKSRPESAPKHAAAGRYATVDELLASPAYDDELKVRGTVAPGTIVRKIVDQEMQTTFVLASKGKSLRVHARGPIPDTFRDGTECVAVGRLADTEGGDVFEATDLQSRCPSRYDTAHAPTDTKFH